MSKLSLDILFQMKGIKIEEIDIATVEGKTFLISIIKKAKEVKEKGIAVPEDIPLYRYHSNYVGDTNKGKLGIGFHVLHQVLSQKSGQYTVELFEDNLLKGWEKINNAHLVEVDRKDLMPGDIAFRTGDEKPDFTERHRYCVILGSKTYACVKNDISIEYEDFNWDYWYKVVPTE